MPTPTARLVAASVARHGKPIYSVEVMFHRFILAEMNTHRAFSRSYRSSRAVPVQTLLDEVRADPWIPVKFGQAQKGMVSGEPITDIDDAREHWLHAAKNMAWSAAQLAKLGIHKEQVNRLLEPFLPAVGVITSTEWDNFFQLRCAPNAAPEMQAIAHAIRDAIQAAEPQRLKRSEWHLPYITVDEREACEPKQLRLISAARCARTSYGKHGERRSAAEELDFANRRLAEGHMSPFEHQATPTFFRGWRSRNFRGWAQHRAAVD